MSKSVSFEGLNHFERKFEIEGASPTNHCRCQITRVIALSCGIKISAVYCLVLSQSTPMQTDGRTDRQTHLITSLRQLIPRYHSCSRGKNRFAFSVCCLKHIAAGAERNCGGAGQKSGERERSGERV